MTSTITAPAVIECTRVSKRYPVKEKRSIASMLRSGILEGEFYALRDIDLVVPRGQMVGLLGRNGAGKSTLLRTVGGIYPVSSGVVHLNDTVSSIYELGISGSDLMTGRAYARRWLGLVCGRGVDIDALMEDVRDFSELGEYFDKRILSYSTGMRARLFFAVATAIPAAVYLIDEVLSVGDEYFQSKCWRRMKQRLSEGASGILATHDWSAILKLCPESYILEHGRVVGHGNSRAMVRQYLELDNETYASGATFVDCPNVVNGVAGQDLDLEIAIEVTEEMNVQFSFAVEGFLPNVGWEHLLHRERTQVASEPGRYVIRLHIPKLPLNAGSYTLQLALGTLSEEGQMSMLDMRSWLRGSEVVLAVSGEPARSVIAQPLNWSIGEIV